MSPWLSQVPQIGKPPHVIEYSLKKVYAGLYEDLVTAFNQTQPLLTLAAYNSEAYRRGAPDESKVNYQALVVGLIRTLLLKRLESSYRSFEASLEELLKKMAGFLAAHDEARFHDWVSRHRRQWDIVLEHQRSRFIDEEQEDLEEEDLLEEPEEILSPDDYDLTRLLNHVVDDMAQVITILTKVYQRLSAKTDDKLNQLVRTLQTNSRLTGEKVVIFTEFRDTARYLYTQLKEKGFEQIEEIDSSRKLDREKVIKRFSPYYRRAGMRPLFGDQPSRPIRIAILPFKRQAVLPLACCDCGGNRDLKELLEQALSAHVSRIAEGIHCELILDLGYQLVPVARILMYNPA